MGKTPDLGQAADALRQLIREANGATKDLRAAIAEARRTAPGIVGEHLDTAIREGLEEYGGTIRAAMNDAVGKVNAKFEGLADILMGCTEEDRKAGKASIPELVEKMTKPVETVTDPRRLGGDITGPRGPHEKGGAIIDTINAVILDYCEVAIGEKPNDGTGDAITLLMAGRINGSRDQARILYVMNEDGAAALVTQIEALVRRGASDGWAVRYERAKADREAEMYADGTWK